MIIDIRYVMRGGKRVLQFMDENWVWFDVPHVLLDRKPRELSPTCRKGHEFTPENTLERADNKRVCRICARARQARWRAKPENREKTKAWGRERHWRKREFKAEEVEA